jgi:hypothetical protein
MNDDTARTLLADFLPIMHACVTKGVADAFKETPTIAHKLRITTRRSITRDLIVDHLIAAFDGDPRVRHVPHNQTDDFNILDTFCLRVKKSDEGFCVELSKTQASFDFNNQEQPELDPAVIGEKVNVYLSYIPDGADPLNPPVYLICPHQYGYEWKLELAPAVAEPDAEITPTKTPDAEVGDLVKISKKPDAEAEE